VLGQREGRDGSSDHVMEYWLSDSHHGSFRIQVSSSSCVGRQADSFCRVFILAVGRLMLQMARQACMCRWASADVLECYWLPTL
jgi:hypothetical protein